MDHMVKFKSSANAGRAFVFGCFEIPVVADAVPSMCDAIIDGYSGRLVMTPEGWHDALEELILSPDRRRTYGRNFAQAIADRFAPAVSAKRLLQFIEALVPRARLKLLRDPPSVVAHDIREEWLRIVRRAERFRNSKKHD